MTRSIFKDPNLNVIYDAQGYVIIRNFYRREDIDNVRRVYEAHFGDVERRPGMWCSQVARYGNAYDEDVMASQRALEEALNGATVPRMVEYFDDARLLSGVVMDKFPGDETSECLPHRDWTMVDESRHEGWLIWSPLNPVSAEHGRVYILPGSHKEEFYGIQAAITPWPYQKFTKIIKRYCQEAVLDPGDALIYSNRAIHGSFPNLTDDNRPVITMGCIEKEAAMWYCWKDRNDSDAPLEIYEIPNDDLDFFYRQNHVDRPQDVKLIEKVPSGFPPYDEAGFEAACRRVAERTEACLARSPERAAV